MKREPFEWQPGGGLGTYILLDRQTPSEVDPITWALWMEAERPKPVGKSLWKVGQALIPGWGSVSTVFLGLDHGWGERAILFESMAFWRPRRDRGIHNEKYFHRKSRSFRGEAGQWRYATWAEAEAGHKKIVAAYRRHGKELTRLYMAGDKRRLNLLLDRVQSSI